jgi:hypothetical protein
MHFSSKIKKFCGGMQIYDTLLDDEKAIHIPFMLNFIVTIKTINDQLKIFLEDLKRHVCQELPDINYNLLSSPYNIMSKRLKDDMVAYGSTTIRQNLEDTFGPLLDMTGMEAYGFLFDNVKLMTEQVAKARKGLNNADSALFEKYVSMHIKGGNWDYLKEEYQNWKNCHDEITMEMLIEKQEQVLQRYIDQGIMSFADVPSTNKVKRVDYDFHKDFLACNFNDNKDYQTAYTQIMQMAKRQRGIIIINLKKYGRYIYTNLSKFSERQKLALYELLVFFELIREDAEQISQEKTEVKAPPTANTSCFRYDSDFVKASVCDIVISFYLGSAANLALIETAFYDHSLLLKRNSHRAFVKVLIGWGALPKLDKDTISKIANGMANKMMALPSSGYEEWDENNYGNDKKTCTDIGMKLGTTMPYSRK